MASIAPGNAALCRKVKLRLGVGVKNDRGRCDAVGEARFDRVARPFNLRGTRDRGSIVVPLCAGGAFVYARERLTPHADRIETNPDVPLGKPIIRCTHFTIELILREFSEGASEIDVLDAYSHGSGADLKAAIKYAADVAAPGTGVVERRADLSNNGLSTCG